MVAPVGHISGSSDFLVYAVGSDLGTTLGIFLGQALGMFLGQALGMFLGCCSLLMGLAESNTNLVPETSFLV